VENNLRYIFKFLKIVTMDMTKALFSLLSFFVYTITNFPVIFLIIGFMGFLIFGILCSISTHYNMGYTISTTLAAVSIFGGLGMVAVGVVGCLFWVSFKLFKVAMPKLMIVVDVFKFKKTRNYFGGVAKRVRKEMEEELMS